MYSQIAGRSTETYSGTCEWCGQQFEREREVGSASPLPRYCSPSHRKKAKEKRRLQHKAERERQPCPRPDKRAYDTEPEARADNAALLRRVIDLTAYECVCGKWHAGKDPAKLAERVRRALNRGRVSL